MISDTVSVHCCSDTVKSYLLPFPEAPIDVDSLDLNKMKVKELKKILNQWDETCHGCVEKSDFIAHIREVKHKHVEL